MKNPNGTTGVKAIIQPTKTVIFRSDSGIREWVRKRMQRSKKGEVMIVPHLGEL